VRKQVLRTTDGRGAAVTVFHDDDWGDHEPPPPIPRIVPVILIAFVGWVLARWALTLTS
jgi:hypothetical protein